MIPLFVCAEHTCNKNSIIGDSVTSKSKYHLQKFVFSGLQNFRSDSFPTLINMYILIKSWTTKHTLKLLWPLGIIRHSNVIYKNIVPNQIKLYLYQLLAWMKLVLIKSNFSIMFRLVILNIVYSCIPASNTAW